MLIFDEYNLHSQQSSTRKGRNQKKTDGFVLLRYLGEIQICLFAYAYISGLIKSRSSPSEISSTCWS